MHEAKAVADSKADSGSSKASEYEKDEKRHVWEYRVKSEFTKHVESAPCHPGEGARGRGRLESKVRVKLFKERDTG